MRSACRPVPSAAASSACACAPVGGARAFHQRDRAGQRPAVAGQMSPCCRRRPARARPRACRWRCWMQVTGRIVMLEPRRLAARAAAERMAETLGERWATVGYRIRGEAQVSAHPDRGGDRRHPDPDDPVRPGPAGIGAVIFDEFHERSLNADLGLALALEMRAALRPDLMAAGHVGHAGCRPGGGADGRCAADHLRRRAFPVETRWLPRPLPKARGGGRDGRPGGQALAETAGGGILAFLPGEGEIRRVEPLLAPCRPAAPSAPFTARWISPPSARRWPPCRRARKVVLATSIAETSLTIADIRVVVDGGRARRARFDPGLGHVAAGHRTRDPGRGRTAPRPRGPRGAGGVLPALDQGRGRRPAPFPPPRSRRPIWPPGAGTGALGQARTCPS
jgi:ATP-dependent helicase HrpB